MLSDEVIDKVVERLINRIEQGNEYILRKIGENIKQFKNIKPSEAQRLYQIIRYGGDYDKIVKRLSEITELNIKDIYEIFNEVAKSDYLFARQFYEYRNKKYIPYEKNTFLKKQVEALAGITAKEYINLTKTTAFAERINGKLVYTEIGKKFNEILDEAILNVGQGKESFDSAMYRSIKRLGTSGIRTVDYESGRSMRLDSAIRMQMKSALTELHEEISTQFGKEYQADGKEVSVHLNPAPDHAEVQGHQFKMKEFEKFQNDKDCKDVNGVLFPATFDDRDRRSIGQYNCYHYTFNIVVGVSQPLYTPEQLQNIIDENEKGFEFEGEHYTNYEGTQLQRKLELEIRKEKDLQILAKASNNEQLIRETQERITQLTKKYKKLSDVSGLLPMMERMRASGYKRTKVDNLSEKTLMKKLDFVKSDKDWTLRMILDNIKDYNLPKTVHEYYDKNISGLKTYNDFKKYFEKQNIKIDTDANSLKEADGNKEIENVKRTLSKVAVGVENYKYIYGDEALSKLKTIKVYAEDETSKAAYYYNKIGENDPKAGTIQFADFTPSGEDIFHELGHAVQDSLARKNEDAVQFSSRFLKENNLTGKAYTGARSEDIDAEILADMFKNAFIRGKEEDLSKVLKLVKYKKG